MKDTQKPFLHRLKLSQRFAVLIVLCAVGFITYGLWSFKTLGELKVNGPLYRQIVQGKDLVADILPPPEYIIESYLVALQADTASAAERPALIGRMRSLKKDYDERHEYWLKEALGDDLKAQFLTKAHEPATVFYRIAFEQFIPALERGDREAAGSALQAMRQAYETHRQAIDQVVQMANARGAADESRARDQIRSASILMLLILAVSMSAVILFVVAVTRSLLREMGGEPAYSVQIANTIAQRDLTVEVETRSGDCDSLLAAMSTMQRQLKSVIGQVNDSASRVAVAAAHLSASAQRVAASSHEQRDATQSMAAAVEEITVSIDHIAQNAGETHEIARKAGGLSQQGEEMARKAAAEMEKISRSTRESSEHIGELNCHAEQISAIVQVIKDIAEQTNLLALNAAIEAARAGEQGRGFAVVADEVRKLAERTTQSTHEIGAMIEGVQRKTGDAVSSMDSGNTQVKAGAAMVADTAASMGSISNGAEHMVRAVSDISSALREQSSASAQVAQSVERIARLSDGNTEAVKEIAEAARSMEGLAASLQTAMSQFRI